jgi:hypothetical protein
MGKGSRGPARRGAVAERARKAQAVKSAVVRVKMGVGGEKYFGWGIDSVK